MSFMLKQSDPSDITRGVELNGIISSSSSNSSSRNNIEPDPQHNIDNDKKIKLLLNAILSGGIYNCDDEKSASTDNEVPKVRVDLIYFRN